MRLTMTAHVLLALLFIASSSPAAEDPSPLLEQLEQLASTLDTDWVQIGKAREKGLAEAQSVRFDQILRKGACYRFLAVGDEKVVDLDIKLTSAKNSLATDQGETDRPMASYCATRDTAAVVTVQVFKGKGQIALGVFAKGGGDDTTAAEEIAAKLALENRASKIATGMIPIGNIATGHLGHHNATVESFHLDTARCYKFLATGTDGVQDLTMTLLREGVEIASDRISGREPVVQWCSPTAGIQVDVKLSMYSGDGAFALGVFGANTKATFSPEKVGGAESDFVANRIRQLHAQFGQNRAAISQVIRGNLSTNNEQVFKVKLLAGHCYSIIGAGSPSVKDLGLTVLSPSGSELFADKTRNSFPVLETLPCPGTTGTYTVRVKMVMGFGQFGAQVFSD